ncbi:hypothetical protein GXP70_07880 [Paenibacillus lycopersici]|uniref:Uncharacterized protein n=1 Tax=Paenibacillus lycopersici TaxID=2704462 RepID=A0A6C0FRU2_9BACL|nr:hypothetical protein [Paenibacillus lycopersici]QHT59876.1 hypothetical protein GXP70_07880 [Paenibacillus lycopersici]
MGYRVMEAIRNYVQHRGLPIHAISHKTSKTVDDRIKHLIVPTLRLKDIENDSKFKKKVLEELKLAGDTVDIRLYIRQYIQSFYKFQKFIRDILIEDVVTADEVFNKYYTLYEQSYGKTTSLAVSRLHLDKFHIEPVQFLSDVIKRRRGISWKPIQQTTLRG